MRVSHGIIGRKVLKGRGALSNPAGRFESSDLEAVDDGWYVEDQPDTIATTVEPDRAKGIISKNNSPDIPFEYSINPYRGCEHGCVYCLSLIHISEPTRLGMISYAVFCLKKKKKNKQ